jgi:hypothetical protein
MQMNSCKKEGPPRERWRGINAVCPLLNYGGFASEKVSHPTVNKFNVLRHGGNHIHEPRKSGGSSCSELMFGSNNSSGKSTSIAIDQGWPGTTVGGTGCRAGGGGIHRKSIQKNGGMEAISKTVKKCSGWEGRREELAQERCACCLRNPGEIQFGTIHRDPISLKNVTDRWNADSVG